MSSSSKIIVLLLYIVSILSATTGVAEAIKRWTPMFVFGDSYLDTGNHNHSESSWQPPYGFTWPGRPAGRFSDGRVLTDFVAEAIGSSSPIPYRICRKDIHRHDIERFGVNFAVGGSGAYEGFDPRNLSVQVNYLRTMVNANCFKLPPMHSTPALISIGGNDYAYFSLTNGSKDDVHNLPRKVVGQIVKNMNRLHQLGLRKFAVSNLNPAGCIPFHTFTVSYNSCIKAVNDLAENHNRLLVQSVHATLSKLKDTEVIIMDQFKAFSEVINHPHLFGLEYSLKPCCQSKLGDIPVCGLVDKDGKPLYQVCADPGKHLFWDGVHPTQAAWNKIVPLMLAGLPNSTRNSHTFPAENFAAWLAGNSTRPPQVSYGSLSDMLEA